VSATPTGPTIVLAAGGTGGHLFPAEALARRLVAQGAAVHLLTDRRADAFATAVPGVMVGQVRAGRFGGGPLHAACGLAELAVGIVQARRRLRRLMPGAVIGFGGYPSVPTMLAAAQLGYPTVIHEQNAVLGRANRVLAGRARTIATGFPETLLMRAADRARAVHTGNPVRPAIAAGAQPYRPPEPGRPIELLIIGGSQGARVFDETVPPALAALPAELRAQLRVSEQARPEGGDAVTARLAQAGIAAEVESFFADMPARLARAQLVICRAGASTIAELAASGRPAILVPYPYAADDHQTANARAFAATGAGWVVAQPDLSAAALSDRLRETLSDPAGLAVAAAAARGFACDDAADRLAAIVLALAGGGAAHLEHAA
jgi:UDP-N-acetylglucosamine--N-acetylmuramyl-(pentapeptide) pyrophosphoryl-undecaprenol N-acetylglucosamine transferase